MNNLRNSILMYISELLLNMAVTIAPKYGDGIVLSKHALNYCKEVSGETDNFEDADVVVNGTILFTEVGVVESDEYLDNTYYLVDTGTNKRMPNMDGSPWEGYHYSALQNKKDYSNAMDLDYEIINIREFRKRYPNSK